jgi:Mn-dependent DtxR family transcriptional regulator
MIKEDVHFLIRSSISRKILECLEKHGKPLSPKQIAKEINVARDNVSTRILWLTKRGLVKCINPEARLWRFYIITDKGKKSLKEVKERIIIE